jgi:hypothetical protein
MATGCDGRSLDPFGVPLGRGWLVPVIMLNIGHGRRREHPKDTSEGVT